MLRNALTLCCCSAHGVMGWGGGCITACLTDSPPQPVRLLTRHGNVVWVIGWTKGRSATRLLKSSREASTLFCHRLYASIPSKKKLKTYVGAQLVLLGFLSMLTSGFYKDVVVADFHLAVRDTADGDALQAVQGGSWQAGRAAGLQLHMSPQALGTECEHHTHLPHSPHTHTHTHTQKRHIDNYTCLKEDTHIRMRGRLGNNSDCPYTNTYETHSSFQNLFSHTTPKSFCKKNTHILEASYSSF